MMSERDLFREDWREGILYSVILCIFLSILATGHIVGGILIGVLGAFAIGYLWAIWLRWWER